MFSFLLLKARYYVQLAIYLFAKFSRNLNFVIGVLLDGGKGKNLEPLELRVFLFAFNDCYLCLRVLVNVVVFLSRKFATKSIIKFLALWYFPVCFFGARR